MVGEAEPANGVLQEDVDPLLPALGPSATAPVVPQVLGLEVLNRRRRDV